MVEDSVLVCGPAWVPNGKLLMILDRLDMGSCQMIIDGQIKLKNDSEIETFTKTGLKFQNGTELEADVVIFATGYVPSHLTSFWSGYKRFGT